MEPLRTLSCREGNDGLQTSTFSALTQVTVLWTGKGQDSIFQLCNGAQCKVSGHLRAGLQPEQDTLESDSPPPRH